MVQQQADRALQQPLQVRGRVQHDTDETVLWRVSVRWRLQYPEVWRVSVRRRVFIVSATQRGIPPMIILAIIAAGTAVITFVLLLRGRKRAKPEVRPTWNVDPVYPTDWQQGTTVAVAVPDYFAPQTSVAGTVPHYVAPQRTSVFTPPVDEDRTYNSSDGLDMAVLAGGLLDYALDPSPSTPDPSPSCDTTSSYDSGSYDSGSSCSDTSSSFDGGSSGGGGADGSWS